jgi:hypothetical protein
MLKMEVSKMKKYFSFMFAWIMLITILVCQANASNVKNYFSQPNAAGNNVLTIGGTQNVIRGGTFNVTTGTATFTTAPVINGGLDINSSIDIDWTTKSQNFNITSSSQDLTMATIYNSSTDLIQDTVILSLDFKDNGDAQGIYLKCRDNTYANTVFKIGADGVVTIDASGAGLGTVLSENTIVSNDATMAVDTETQDWKFGDGTNDTVFGDNGAITQTGSATLTVQDGSDIIVTANPNASPFVSATGDDTMLGALTMGSASADGGVFSIIKGTTGSDPTYSVTQGATGVTIGETVGDIAMTAADDITVAAAGIVIVSTSATSNTLTLAEGTGNAAFLGSVTGTGSFIVGSADLNETEMEKLDGITDGTAAANKALVCTTGPDIAGIRNLTCITGTATDLTVTSTLNVPGTQAISSSGGLALTYGMTAATSTTTSWARIGYAAGAGMQVSSQTITFGNGERIENLVDGSMKFTDGTNPLITITDAGTTGNVAITGTLAVTGAPTFTGAQINSAGKIGYTTANAPDKTMYDVITSTTLAADGTFSLALADGKAGSFEIIGGTHCAIGSFTTAGAPTLAANSTPDITTTAATTAKVNVSDGGTAVLLTNKTAASIVFFIKYMYVN